MNRPTVLLTDSDLGDRDFEVGLLRDELDAEVIVAECKTEDDVIREVASRKPDAIVTQWAPITAAVIDAATGCRVISRVGIGTDMIDHAAAERAGIPVLNVPHYCTEEVATHATALAMSLWRRLPQFDAQVRSGRWSASEEVTNITRLSNATVALVGCGRIGLLVAKAFEVWGAEIIVVDPIQGSDGYERVSLAAVAERADIISLHVPLVPSTHHIIGEEFLGSLRRRPVLVNTSRGPLVDVAAAVRAVESGALRGLGLDVFESEPLALDDTVRNAPNTILAPHAAWCSTEALPDLRRGAMMNVVDVLRAARVS